MGSAGLRSISPNEPAAPVEERAEPGARTPRDKVTLSAEAKALSSSELTPEQQQVVAELRARDAEVRAHEAAHQAAGGELAGGASFTYQTGPDGRQYAVGGEVGVALRSGRTPDETIANAQRVRRAALAPANPSTQDLAVASAASSLEASARSQKSREVTAAYQERRGGGAGSPLTPASAGSPPPSLPASPW